MKTAVVPVTKTEFWLYDTLWAVTEARLLTRAARCDRATFEKVIQGKGPWLEAHVPFAAEVPSKVVCAVPERLIMELAVACTPDPEFFCDRRFIEQLMMELAFVVSEQWLAFVSNGTELSLNAPIVVRVPTPALHDATYFPALFRGNPALLRIVTGCDGETPRV